jgi:hypothetical protein
MFYLYQPIGYCLKNCTGCTGQGSTDAAFFGMAAL